MQRRGCSHTNIDLRLIFHPGSTKLYHSGGRPLQLQIREHAALMFKFNFLAHIFGCRRCWICGAQDETRWCLARSQLHGMQAPSPGQL